MIMWSCVEKGHGFFKKGYALGISAKQHSVGKAYGATFFNQKMAKNRADAVANLPDVVS